MSASSAVKRLAGQIALLSSEYRKVLKRCARLERKVEQLSGNIENREEPDDGSLFIDGDTVKTGSIMNKEQVLAKLEEMLAELANLG